jgi:histidyl-tRNA synthetase
MTEDKGLDGAVADKIGEYVQLKGSRELLEKLQADSTLMANESAKKGIDDMALLFDYLEAFDVLSKVSFDMSLARGLDYYTGVIYEVVTEGSAPKTSAAQKLEKTAKAGKGKELKAADADEDRSNDPSVGVGSVAAGGRYDELVGMFSGKQQIPCVGISFGVDRIFSIIKSRMEADKKAANVRSNEVDVYVMAFGGKGFTGLLKERMNVAKTLWDAKIKAEFSWKVKPKLPAQFKQAEQGGVPFAVILGEAECEAGECKIKEMGLPEGHPEKDGVTVKMDRLVEEVQSRLAQWYEQNPVDTLSTGTAQLAIDGN